MRIQHNIAAVNSHRQLGMNNSAVSKNLEKLSSGYRINRAGDDAAGLAISEKMRAQITGLETAQKNAQDGISLVQTAEGALTEVHSMLNRMTELAGQAANGTYQDDVDRENAMKEMDSLRSEIDRISEGTNYNGINLLDGSLGGGGGLAAKAVKLGNATTTESAAAAGRYQMSAGVTSTLGAAGDTFEFTVTYKDNADSAERTAKFSLAVKVKDDGSKALINASGKEYTIACATTGATAAEIDAALRTEVANSPLADKFKVGYAGGAASAINFEARDTGSDGAIITGFSERTIKAGVTADKAITTSITAQAADSYKELTASGIQAYDGTNPDKATFTVNGKKFALAAAGTDVTGLGKDVTVLTGAAFTADHANIISQKTGLNVTHSAAATATSGAANTLIFKPAVGTAGNGGLSLQIGDTSAAFNQLNVAVGSMSSASLGVSGVDISTQDGAKAAVDVIKDAINQVSSTRGDLGAIQNRLEHTINNLGVTSENMTAAESRIRDVDMAKEMMTFTKNNILTQAAQAMLAQANQLPQGVLQLLQ